MYTFVQYIWQSVPLIMLIPVISGKSKTEKLPKLGNEIVICIAWPRSNSNN